jgi:hypothetical protein
VPNRAGWSWSAVIVLVVALTGCRSGQPSATPSPRRTAGIVGVTASSPPSTCGTVPVSNGPLASKATVQIDGPSTAPSGSTFGAQVRIRSTSTSMVAVESVSIVNLLITQNGRIVGRTLGASAGTGASFDATPTSVAQLTADVILSDCGNYTPDESLPDLRTQIPDATRTPLPAGQYTMYAVVEDDTFGEENPRSLVSAPFPLQITPASTVSAPATGTAMAALDRTFTQDGGSFRYPSAWTLSQFPDDVRNVGDVETLFAVVSNQPVQDPCVSAGGNQTCGRPLNALGTGGVVILWTQDRGIGATYVVPSGSPTTIEGKQATVTTNPSDSQCLGIAGTVYELDAYVEQSPGNGWSLAACVAAPAAPQAISTVTAMLQSIRFDSDPS